MPQLDRFPNQFQLLEICFHRRLNLVVRHATIFGWRIPTNLDESRENTGG